ncbi:MAG TPA: PIN domain-containing protein [Polyangia bacterium]|jgi:PIN domain nuclease of toxin-antitoxin system
MSLAAIDTHALLWAITGQRQRLGRAARRLVERADRGQAALYVPTMVLVEIGEAEWRGAIRLRGGFDAWLEGLLSTGRFHAVDLSVAIVRRAQALFAIAERGDRLIAATAAELEVPLITRDPAIGEAAGVDVIW